LKRSWFHPEEATQVGVLMGHEDDHPGTRYHVEFADGATCVYDASYESENTGDGGIEMGDPLYDEFHPIAMEVVEAVPADGSPFDGLTIDYRDFPIRITDIDADTVAYPPAEGP
jgi:hypothetical protein